MQRRVDLMAAEGVRFVTSAHVGKVRPPADPRLTLRYAARPRFIAPSCVVPAISGVATSLTNSFPPQNCRTSTSTTLPPPWTPLCWRREPPSLATCPSMAGEPECGA